MAKFSSGPLVAEIHGSVGGITFATSPGGQVIRKHCPPKSNHTIAQRAAQHSFSKASRAWRELSDPLKLAWNRAATNISGVKSVSAFRLTGFQLWMKTYAPVAASYSLSSTAQPTSTATPPLVLSLVSGFYDIPSLNTAFYSMTPIADTVVFAFGALALDNTPSSSYLSWRYLGSGLYDDSPLDFISGWLSKLGTPPVDRYAGIRVFAVAPGHPPSVPLLVRFYWTHS
jgi:hypothetical protein